MNMCIGCRTCQVACKEKNDLDVGVNFRRVRTFETGTYPDARGYHISGSCNHCRDALCVKNCPAAAMYYADDKTVQLDSTKCTGCRRCITACPYGAPQFIEEKGVSGKCDSCKTLRDRGENPRCADACIMRCLEFSGLDELINKHGPDLTRELPALPPESITKPALLINPKSCALDPAFRDLLI